MHDCITKQKLIFLLGLFTVNLIQIRDYRVVRKRQQIVKRTSKHSLQTSSHLIPMWS